MQIIQTIRDKGAAIVIAVIALSLIGFILMDAKPGSNGGIFSSSSTTVGKVNSESIELNDFNRRTNFIAAQEEKNGQQVTSMRTYQLRDQMWNQMVAEKIFYAETEKLGIELTSRELSAILLSNDPSNPLMQKQELLDETSRQLDMGKVQKYLAENLKNAKGDKGAEADAEIVEPLKLTTAVAKYSGLLNASAYYPAWMQKKDAAETKNFALISYVTVPFNDISDSTVKVSDQEINDYVAKHKDLFKQEAGRMISYVGFSQQPSREDSNRVRTMVEDLKAPFAADSNAGSFVTKNASAIEFDDNFKTKDKFAGVANFDSLVAAPQGSIYGPYTDAKNYVLAKVIASKPIPDSVRARHILLQTYNPQTKEQMMPDTTAKKLADSILAAVNGGADFAALAAKYSMDQGSGAKGGDVGTFGHSMMVPEFETFAFTKPVGSKDVVRTVFGYHVIEVMEQKAFKPGYKIAFLAKEIMPTDATINKASLDATKASAEKDAKGLAAYAQKNGYSLTQVPTIVKENDFSVGGLQDARQLVRWVFDAKKGAVSEPFNMGDQFVVAVVDKIQEEGVQDAETARSGSEVIIRNEKKAKIIMDKLGNNPTLEAAAAAYNKQVLQAGADSSITMAGKIINGLGIEPKVIGASFDKEFQTKVSPSFAGNTGVFVIKVNSIQSKPADTPEMAAQQLSAKLAALRNETNNWYEGLKKLADIKDKRSKYF
jgi:peptidyl-prolyl cis-trans isomerase D